MEHYILHRPLTNEALIGRDSEDCWQSLLYVTVVIRSWPDNVMTALSSLSHSNKKIREITWSVLWISPLRPCPLPAPDKYLLADRC